MRSHQILLASLSILPALISEARGQTPLGTAFTYQGQLKNNGTPLNATADFKFTLFHIASGGTQVGWTQPVNNVTVADGLFTVQLNDAGQFGAAAFNGDMRFLEIAVRSPAGGGAYTTLSPRQALIAAPHAIFSLNAAAAESASTATTATNATNATNAINATNATQLNGQPADFYTNAANLTGTLPSGLLSGTYAGALTLGNASNSFAGSGAGLTALNADNIATGTVPDACLSSNTPRLNAGNTFGNFTNSFLGNVGIGTTTPATPLHVVAPTDGSTTGQGVRIQGTASGVANQAYLSFNNSAGEQTGYIGDGGGTENNIQVFSALGHVVLYTGVGPVLTATSNGNVGIGTASPAVKLDVRGDIRLGASGQFHAPAGEENLRIIRGTVALDGSIIAGSGFSVSHPSTGQYIIAFNTSFSGLPSVTATGQFLGGCQTSVNTSTISSSGVELLTALNDCAGDPPYNVRFQFIAVGPR